MDHGPEVSSSSDLRRDREALTKKIAKSRAMTNIFAERLAEERRGRGVDLWGKGKERKKALRELPYVRTSALCELLPASCAHVPSAQGRFAAALRAAQFFFAPSLL